MKIASKINNGILLIVIGLLHTQFTLSAGGFGIQFLEFSKAGFFNISPGMDELPALAGHTNFETFSAFWFFYFGILLIILGLLIHTIEKNKITLPLSFTISYFIMVLVGVYMIPNSGITFFMLPHAAYMLISNLIKSRRQSGLTKVQSA
ncbi:MAG: DUF6463 family protein [Reichenbachiella sp.]